MSKLGVNVDHVATLRQARKTFEPDPVRAALACEAAGAASVVVHLREDSRHIQERDLELIKKLLNIKVNLEMAATGEMVRKAVQILPGQATLVPERAEEITTEGGLDVISTEKNVMKTAETLKRSGITVSIFVDPDPEQIKSAKQAGADIVEIHTGIFAEAFIKGSFTEELSQVGRAVQAAQKAGLAVHAGHGLTYLNARSIAEIPGIHEFNIGHSIISRSVFTGLERAVRDMLDIISSAGRCD